MPLNHFTLTIPNPAVAVRLSSVLPDGKAIQENGQHDISYAFLSFELQSGTGCFIGDSTVSATNYAAKVTATKTYEPHGGAMRLGDLWVIGTAGDKLQIGGVPL